MTTDYKLANVVLRVEEHAKQHPEIYYHINAGNVSYDEQDRSRAILLIIRHIPSINVIVNLGMLFRVFFNAQDNIGKLIIRGHKTPKLLKKQQ